MIACTHCGAYRRSDGGLKIGGRVALTLLPACICPALDRVLYNVDKVLSGQVTTITSSNFATLTSTFRYCQAVTHPHVRPVFDSFTCDNYNRDDLQWYGNLTAANLTNPGCAPNYTSIGYGECVFIGDNPNTYLNNWFGGSSTAAYHVGLVLYVLAPFDFVDPPIVSFRIKLDSF